MSAFVIENDVMDRIMTLLTAQTWLGQVARQIDTYVLSSAQMDDLDGLPRAMFQLNRAAVAYRYPHHQEPEADAALAALHDAYRAPRDRLFLRYDTTEHRGALCDGLKALDCFLYQCNEGDQFSDTAIYRDLRGTCDQVREIIVSGLPEYEAASWG